MPDNNYATLSEAMEAHGIPVPCKPVPMGHYLRWGDNSRYYAIRNEKCVCFGDWKTGHKLKWFPPSDTEMAKTQRDRSPLFRPAQYGAKVTHARTFLATLTWRECVGASGTLVETYLKSRGYDGAIPPTLRFHSGKKHIPSGEMFPVMVAAVCAAPDRNIIGIHRTYLAPDGRGKADVPQPKMCLGIVKGGAVRLRPAGETLAIAEGIETALSVMQATSMPTWAALSATGIENLILPPLPLARDIVICADNDANSRGQQAAHKAALRWIAEGRSVRIALPPLEGQDFNDLLCEEIA